MMTQPHSCAANKSPRCALPIDSENDECDIPPTITAEFAEFMALPSAALFRIAIATQDI